MSRNPDLTVKETSDRLCLPAEPQNNTSIPAQRRIVGQSFPLRRGPAETTCWSLPRPTLNTQLLVGWVARDTPVIGQSRSYHKGVRTAIENIVWHIRRFVQWCVAILSALVQQIETIRPCIWQYAFSSILYQCGQLDIWIGNFNIYNPNPKVLCYFRDWQINMLPVGVHF